MTDENLLASKQEADVIAFIDEAGDRGYLRSLTTERDHEISLMCALPVPAKFVDDMRELLREPFERFCSAAPENAKLHITDAFSSGNQAWSEVARDVREDIFQILIECQFRVIFAARRLRVAREMYEISESTKELGRQSVSEETRAKYRIKGANRPTNETIEDRVMSDLALLLDAFLTDGEYQLVDLHFDEVDRPVAKRYAEHIEATRNISNSTHTVTARNMETNSDESRMIHFSTNREFDTTHVGEIIVAGKSDPLVFAVDVVANSLWRHLKNRAGDASLNDADALSGWSLESITVYDRSGDPSMMDRI